MFVIILIMFTLFLIVSGLWQLSILPVCYKEFLVVEMIN